MHRLKALIVLMVLSHAAINAQGFTVVDVNLNHVRSIGNDSVFNREKFVNFHGGYNEGSFTDAQAEYIGKDLRVNYGRKTGTINWQVNEVNEDAARPGHADLAHMQTLAAQVAGWYNTSRDPYKTDEVILSSIPHPFYPDGTETKQGWSFADHSATAEYIAHFIKNYYSPTTEPTPKFYEVINEPVVGLKQVDNADIFAYHNVVADSVRKINPDVMVGGYCAAYPEYEASNFGHWNNNWKSFIDIAGDNMDFFSFHIYDTPKEGNTYSFRKGSNAEALFDIIEQYSVLKLGERKPFIISEFGACCGDLDEAEYSSFREWRAIKSFNSLLLTMMDRPDQMLKAVPFIMANTSGWAGLGYPHDIFENATKENDFSDHIKFYELWKDVDGIRIDSKTRDLDIQSDAFVEGKTLHLILNNLHQEETDVILNIIEGNSNAIQSVTIKHLHLKDNNTVLEETTLTEAPEYVTIDSEGTIILEYTFTNDIALNKSYKEAKYYSDKYLQTITQNSTMTFNINGVETGTIGEAMLRIGMGRDHGKSLQPTVLFNGTEIEVPADFKGYDQHNRNRFFGVIEVPVPYNLLQENNVIKITYTDATNGHVSSVTLRTAMATEAYTRTTGTLESPRASYTLNINAENGIVRTSPDDSEFVEGSSVWMVAVPNTGYEFSGWTGDVSSAENPITITMDNHTSLTANFTKTSSFFAVKLNSTEMFPNPGNNMLNINFGANMGLVEISVCNLNGSELIESTSTEQNASIDISQLLKGIYVVNLKTSFGTVSKKLIKQ